MRREREFVLRYFVSMDDDDDRLMLIVIGSSSIVIVIAWYQQVVLQQYYQSMSLFIRELYVQRYEEYKIEKRKRWVQLQF